MAQDQAVFCSVVHKVTMSQDRLDGTYNNSVDEQPYAGNNLLRLRRREEKDDYSTAYMVTQRTFRFRQTEAMLLSEGNKGGVTFSLLGFSDYPKLKIPLFLVFLAICSVTVVGNIGMIVIIKINPKLHTPIYFFLSHLSFVDFCYSSIIALKILENLVVEDRTISFLGCVVQLFLFGTFVVTESILLAVMAYDRFVAICNPLLYTVASLYTEILCYAGACGLPLFGRVSACGAPVFVRDPVWRFRYSACCTLRLGLFFPAGLSVQVYFCLRGPVQASSCLQGSSILACGNLCSSLFSAAGLSFRACSPLRDSPLGPILDSRLPYSGLFLLVELWAYSCLRGSSLQAYSCPRDCVRAFSCLLGSNSGLFLPA
ncbi:olfactory receptor 5J3-like [Loxodonta africana]|uniref:olfactory receptor 5J3-like n=1 Tax=Loxodonta africana TaxID=9785 RepID=UPI0030D1E4B9